MSFLFEELKVYQKSVDFADGVIEAASDFPKDYRFLKDQLRRAALSIPANLAEGNGRFTTADRRNFFVIARGSIQECVPLLEISRRRRLIADDTFEGLRQSLEQAARMLGGLIRANEQRPT